MRMIFGLAMALALAAGAQEYVEKSASTTTSNTVVVTWPGTMHPLRLVSLNATSDSGTSVLTWRVGATASTVAVAALATATNVKCLASTLASNNVVLLQNAGGSVTQATVWGRSSATNAVLTFDYPLGTNMVIGDIIAKKRSTALTTGSGTTSNSTVLFLGSTNDLTVDTNIITDYGGKIWKTTIAALNSGTIYSCPLDQGALVPLEAGDAVYSVTNKSTYLLAAQAAADTSLHVAASTLFGANSNVVIESASGALAVKAVDSVSTTNVTLKTALGIAMPAGSRLWLSRGATTAKLPVLAGDRTLQLAASNGFGLGRRVVAVPTTGQPWWRNATAGCTAGTYYSVTLSDGTPEFYPAGTKLYALTNLFTLTQAAGKGQASVTANTSSGLSAGDEVVLLPATGGSLLNRYRSAETRILDTVSFTAAPGLAMAVDDRIYSTTSTTTPVGATSVHWFGPALYVAPAGRPGLLSLDCGTNGAINSAVGYQ